jgi:Acetoacetate decarboxylase (ADC)
MNLTIRPAVETLSSLLGASGPQGSGVGMADFIEQPGDPELPPPYRFPGVSITSFRLDANLGALQALCDSFLNIGTLAARGFEYRAVIPYVDMEILYYPRMECLAPPYAGNGYTSQREIYFRFFVLKYQLVGGLLLPTAELACFFPFIFVDNPWSVIAGREVIGFPKELASFGLPPSGPYPINVATQVFAQYGGNTPLTWETFVTINAAASGSGAQQIPAGPWPWGELTGIDPVLGTMLEQSGVLQESIFSTIHFKQFRDAEFGMKASYQALVQGSFNVTALNNMAPMPAAEIVIANHESLPIIQLLGLPESNLAPLWQYILQCDMEFSNTRDLYVVTG